MASVWQRAVETIKAQPLLDRPASLLDRAFNRALAVTGSAEPRVRNFLHGTWMEHPLHPTLTDIPLGAWTAAFFMDLLSFNDDERPNHGADAAIAIGLAGAASAAVTGLADYQHIDNQRVRRLGAAHALSNTTAASLYATSLLLRLAGMRRAGRRVSFLAYGVLGVGGYLGGYLVFGQRMGVKHSPTVEGLEDFVPVARLDELLDDRPLRVKAGSIPVLLVRSNGAVHAMTDDCTHLGCSLAAGRLEGDAIRCGCHGSRFRLRDGAVLEGPATFPATAFETRINGDQVEIRLPG